MSQPNWVVLEATPHSDYTLDLVFADAPYDLQGSETVVPLVLDGNLLREGGIFIFEHSDDKNFSDHPYFWQSRNYGSVHFSFFKKD